jgi:hypothetical protein
VLAQTRRTKYSQEEGEASSTTVILSDQREAIIESEGHSPNESRALQVLLATVMK